MSEPRTETSRSEALIEAMDRPLLILAVVTMILYLFDLRGLMDWSPRTYHVADASDRLRSSSSTSF